MTLLEPEYRTDQVDNFPLQAIQMGWRSFISVKNYPKYWIVEGSPVARVNMRSRNKVTCSTRLLVIIPVELGSKRIPRKNLRTVSGKTLLNRTIDCAADVVDAFGDSVVDVVISTLNHS